MTIFPAVFQLSDLDGTNGFRFEPGLVGNDYLGCSVSLAGDINGDGFDDLIVGDEEATAHGYYSGAAYVVFGRASGFSKFVFADLLDGTNGFKLSGGNSPDGEASYYGVGTSVASAGDINGDGFDDVIIGANGASYGAFSGGASYVVFGKASGFAANLDLSALNGANGFRIDGVAAFDTSGGSVASAGDVNGDGFDDLIIGADNAMGDGWFSGVSYVVFGKASGFGASLSLSSLDGSNGFRLSGSGWVERSGTSVASAGDVNGDGFDDVLIGADQASPNGNYSGAAYLVFGKASGFDANISLSALDGTDGFRISGEKQDDSIGRSVSSAGDVNGDGFDDLIIGAPFFETTVLHDTVHVLFGKASGFAANIDVSSLDGTNGFSITGLSELQSSGCAVTAGDVNGDGFDDLIIGAESNGQEGTSYVVFGKATGFAASIDVSSLDGNNGFRIEGDYLNAGYSISAAGDINDDGFDDISFGAPIGGAAMVLFGHRALTAATIIGTSQGLIHNGGFGDDLVVAGDGDDTLKGWEGNDYLSGGRGADVAFGDDGNDTVKGWEGNAALNGGAGNDKMNGGAGNDILTGGAGRDALTGAGGKDIFFYEAIGESGARATRRDVIIGFKVNPDEGRRSVDKIDLSAIDASNTAGGNNAFTFIGDAAFTGDGQIRAVQDGANTVVEINTRGVDTPEMTILLRNFTATDLTAADFVL